MRSPHTSYRWRGERDIETIKCMLYHTPATGGEEREDIETISVCSHHNTSYQVERREKT